MQRRVWWEQRGFRLGTVWVLCAARAGFAPDGRGICCPIPSQMGGFGLSWLLCPHAGTARQFGDDAAAPRALWGCRELVWCFPDTSSEFGSEEFGL